MSEWLLVILVMLTTYRITRLVIADTFPPIEKPRVWLINYWWPDEDWKTTHPNAVPNWGKLGWSFRYLFTCPWCMSVWVGGPLIIAVDQWYDVPVPWLVWAASSAVTGLLSGLEDKLS